MKKHTKRENTSPVFSTTGPRGHRQRMRQKVLENGPSWLADYEILEMLLFAGVPRRDTKPLAKAALTHCGSFSNVLEASPELLRQIGVPEASVRLLGTIVTIAQSVQREAKPQKLALKDWDTVVHYVSLRLDSVEEGHLRVLFLDSQNCLIADEPVNLSKNKDSLQESITHIMRRTLMHQACAVVTIRFTLHEESKNLLESDKVLAIGIAEAAHVLAIEVYGHLVLGRGGWCRFTHDDKSI